jgi:hypothetical protein
MSRQASNAKSTNNNIWDDVAFVATKLLSDNSETSWVLEPGATFAENGDGTARLTGVFKQFGDFIPARRLQVNLLFSGQTFTPPANAPYNETGVSTAGWYYYTSVSGDMTGLDTIAGGRLTFNLFMHPFQVGVGANQINNIEDQSLNGAAGWLSWTIQQQPTGGLQFNPYIAGTTICDIAILLSGTPSVPPPCPCQNDTEKPRITCESNRTIPVPCNQDTGIAIWSRPLVTDNCSSNLVVTQTSGATSGSSFPLGTTTIVYTATDAAGNTATCSFTITVVRQTDSQAPIFQNCPRDLTLTASAGSTCSTATWTAPTATDNNGAATLVKVSGPNSGQCLPCGTTYPVVYEATDICGNKSVCRFTIKVNCPADPCEGIISVRTVSSTKTNCGTQTPYAMWYNQEYYTAGSDLKFTEYTNGTAALKGSVVKNGVSYAVHVTFSGRTTTPPTNSPKYELCATAANTNNAHGWVYYPNMTGTIQTPTGTVTIQRFGPAPQQGQFGNLQENRLGLSAWFGVNGVHKGDFNINLGHIIACAPVTPPSSCAGNLITNFSFESDLTGYQNWGNAAIISTDVVSGNKAVRIGTAAGGLGLQGLNAIVGGTYTFRAKAKISGSPSWTGLGIKFYDANWNACGEKSIAVTTTSYQDYTVTAVAPAHAKYAQAWAWKSGSTGYLMTDDWCLTVTPPAPAPTCTTTFSATKCYKIVNRASGMVLDISGASTANDAKVIQWAAHTGANQQWRFYAVGSGFYKLVARHSGKVLACHNTYDGAAVYQYSYYSGGYKDWSFECMTNGYIRIRHRASGKYLCFRNTTQGTQATIDLWNGANAMQWQVVEVACATAQYAGSSAVNELQAQVVNNKVALNFMVNNGFENDFYTVEKMNNQSGDFEKLSLINNIDFSEAVQTHAIIDAQATEGENTYRVKTTLSDGTEKFTAPKTVNFKHQIGFIAYPNPASDEVNLNLGDYTGKAVLIRVYNNVGKQVFQKQIEQVTETTQNLLLSDYPVGQYLIRISSEGKRDASQQLIIQK